LRTSNNGSKLEGGFKTTTGEVGTVAKTFWEVLFAKLLPAQDVEGGFDEQLAFLNRTPLAER